MDEFGRVFIQVLPIGFLASYLVITTLIWYLDRKHSWKYYFTHPKAQMRGE